MTVTLSLPYPPSVNGIFAMNRGSRLSEKYRLWRDEAGWALREQRPAKLAGPVSISVELKAPDKRRRDLDNVGFKAVIDLLVKHQIIEADDSRIVKEIKAKWVSEGNPCTVFVEAA
jgi:Holliday junction resolvase RusA-like endonuclease